MTMIQILYRPSARALSGLLVGLAALLAIPSPAHALGNWVGVEAAPWMQGLSGEATIDSGSLAGTSFDFEDTLDLGGNDTAPVSRVWFRFAKSHLTVDYFDSTRNGTSTLTSGLNFNGTGYASGETIDSDLELKLLQAHYRYSFVDLKVAEFGMGLTLNAMQVGMEMNGSATGLTTFNETIPFPTLNATFVAKPLPMLHIRAEANGANATVSGHTIDILDARLQIESYFLHSFGIFGGYRTYRLNVDSGDFGHIEDSFDGPYLGLGLKF